MGLTRLELVTSRLSGVRSNRLSYEPIDSGDHLLSQAASHQVPSTAQVLTVVFGMGTGVSPERIFIDDTESTKIYTFKTEYNQTFIIKSLLGQALDLLVLVS